MQNVELRRMTTTEMNNADVRIMKLVWVVGGAIATVFVGMIAAVSYLGGAL